MPTRRRLEGLLMSLDPAGTIYSCSSSRADLDHSSAITAYSVLRAFLTFDDLDG